MTSSQKTLLSGAYPSPKPDKMVMVPTSASLMHGENAEHSRGGKMLPAGGESGILKEDGEERSDYIQGEDGKMRGSRPGGGKSGSGKKRKTKYASSPQRNHERIQLGPKTYAKLCGVVGTRYPGLQEGEVRRVRSASKTYTIHADGYGGFTILSVQKIE